MPSISINGDGIAYGNSPGLTKLGIGCKSYFVDTSPGGTKAVPGKGVAATLGFALICALSLTACGGGDTSACSDENFMPPVSFYVNENNEITSYGPAYNRAASLALLQGVWVDAYWGVMTISADGSFSIDPSIELAGITRSIGYLVHYEGAIALVDPDQNIYAVKRRLIKEPRPGSGLPSFSGDNVAHVFFYLSDSACGETNDLLFYAGTEPPTGVSAYTASGAFRRVVQ